ncbi:MAG: flagellar biosynthesis anti-sigma factor FlgM [Nitrospirae bacterium]|nr:flagellar biosynthesis anti-sigma factor FlgM [Nitrospirota bacterium]
MKIHHNKPPETQDIYVKNQKPDVNVSKVAAGEGKDEGVKISDKVNISARAKDIEKLKEAINDLPDVRTQKVESVKNAIMEGTYEVNSIKVAERMLEEEIL